MAFSGASGTLPQRVGFVLIPDFSMIAFTAAVEPLRIANRMAGRALYAWRLLSKDGGPVEASNGIAVAVDRSLAQVPAEGAETFDAVILCSGLHAERFRDKETIRWLQGQGRGGRDLGALCTGAHILAYAGLLDGYRCTIHWENLPAFRETFPAIDVHPDLFEIDRDRFTCCGGTAALDLMIHFIAREHGEALAAKVSEQCLLDRVRGAQDPQRMPLRLGLARPAARVRRSVEIMDAHLEEPLKTDALARYVGLSRRQLERLFRANLGRPPTRFYLERRLERARQLLCQTDLPVLEVALACGFVSASHFSKCYRQMYGRAPRAERRAAQDSFAA